MEEEIDERMTTPQLANYLKISTAHVNKMASKGEIPSIMMRTRRIFFKSTIDKLFTGEKINGRLVKSD